MRIPFVAALIGALMPAEEQAEACPLNDCLSLARGLALGFLRKLRHRRPLISLADGFVLLKK
jgi:hypothetical protein